MYSSLEVHLLIKSNSSFKLYVSEQNSEPWDAVRAQEELAGGNRLFFIKLSRVAGHKRTFNHGNIVLLI